MNRLVLGQRSPIRFYNDSERFLVEEAGFEPSTFGL